MAQLDILKLEKITKERNLIHDKVYTTYTVFDAEGNRYVQIDTYGKSDRAYPGKISQSIQLDQESAKVLIDILKESFQL